MTLDIKTALENELIEAKTKLMKQKASAMRKCENEAEYNKCNTEYGMLWQSLEMQILNKYRIPDDYLYPKPTIK